VRVDHGFELVTDLANGAIVLGFGQETARRTPD
jgi:hypothetical protein